MLEIFEAGGPVMYPLLLCSIAALAVIVDRSFLWIRIGLARQPGLVAELQHASRQGHRIPAGSGAWRDPIAQVLLSGLKAPKGESRWHMHLAAERQLKRLTRNLGVLSTMVALAPLLGIFGTVLGIIDSFQLLGNVSLTDHTQATAGLAQALITTAFGLGIAMPSLIAFRIFHAWAMEMREDLEQCCTELELGLNGRDSEYAPPPVEEPVGMRA